LNAEDESVEYKLELVVVPVSDVDRAKHFYSELVGFVVDVDQSSGDAFRVVQLTPPGSACSISIGRGLGDGVPGSLKGMQLSVADVEAARADLLSRGEAVSTVQHHDGTGFVDGKGGDWNSFLFFTDPDGNSWAIQESPTLRGATADAGAQPNG
jgi:catechol 2,3-dioxygenase-like lactoylglutathione lyase family enzyme